jgi:hypothetical protein
MKKAALFVGVVGLLMVGGVDVSAAECRHGLAKMASGSNSGDEISSTLAAECAPEKTFHIPAAVPLFLSAIAGLGIVALRGKTR